MARMVGGGLPPREKSVVVALRPVVPVVSLEIPIESEDQARGVLTHVQVSVALALAVLDRSSEHGVDNTLSGVRQILDAAATLIA
jgi:hypothetical protein